MVYKYIYYSSSPTYFGPLLTFFRDIIILEKGWRIRDQLDVTSYYVLFYFFYA